MTGRFTEVFSSKDLQKWDRFFQALEEKGVYHNPIYIKEYGDHVGFESELFVYGDENNFVYHPYFKRRLDNLEFLDNSGFDFSKYYDIISSWYYGGPLLHVADESVKKKLIKEFLTSFHQYCLDANIVCEFIRFDPNLKNYEPFKDFLPLKFDRQTVYVNLTQPLDNIWTNFEKRNRNAIRMATKRGVSVELSLKTEDMDDFARVYESEMIRKNATGHYYFNSIFFRDMKNALRDAFLLFQVKLRGEPIGGGICARESGVAHDYLAATLFDYWDCEPNNLLLFEEIKWCKENGDKIFDLQGGRPRVFNFKKAFSKERGEFHTTSVIHNNETYNSLVRLAEKAGNVIPPDYFPGYRIKES